jgi:hypothetical protein
MANPEQMRNEQEQQTTPLSWSISIFPFNPAGMIYKKVWHLTNPP